MLHLIGNMVEEQLLMSTKTYKGDYYSVNSIFGNDWAIFYILCGGRSTGKSYDVMKWGIRRKAKLKDQLKWYWFRLTDNAVKNLLAGGADKLVDPDLKRKYNLNLMSKNSTVYTYDKVTKTKKDGTEYEVKANQKEFLEVLSCSTFYNTKGVGYFDNEYKGEYLLVLDEMNREQSEKNSFDIVYNFVNLIENLVRETHTKIKVIMIGNTLDEASDILSAFNFIPDGFGRFKLKSKKCVIDNIKPNEAYLKRRKESIANILLPNASTFTNEISIDRSLLVNKRQATRPDRIIKFSKNSNDWFTLCNNRILRDYKKSDEGRNVTAMKKYLDEVYNQELVDWVFETFNARYLLFTSLACFKRFQKQLKLLKK